MEEAERKIQDKTVVLEGLGKARGFVDVVLGLGTLAAEVRIVDYFIFILFLTYCLSSTQQLLQLWGQSISFTK